MTDKDLQKGLPEVYAVISTAKPSEAVLQTLRLVSESSTGHSMAILALDQRFFCTQAPASLSEKLEAVATLLQCFVAEVDQDAEGGDEGEIPPELRRNLPQDPLPTNSPVSFASLVSSAVRLSQRFVAGVLLLDIASYSWQQLDLTSGQTDYLHVSDALVGAQHKFG